jgi:hypothetical protein
LGEQAAQQRPRGATEKIRRRRDPRRGAVAAAGIKIGDPGGCGARAANSHAVPDAAANTTVPAMPMPIAGSIALRRPTWSASRPKNNSATRLPST